MAVPNRPTNYEGCPDCAERGLNYCHCDDKKPTKPATHFDWVEPSFATPMDEILKRMGDETSLPEEAMIYEELDKEKIEIFEVESLAISERGKDWLLFAFEVLTHIESYACKQYGDKGSDQCSSFSNEDFLTQIRKYCNRFGKNIRSGQETLDLKKAAHYVQMLFTKITEEKKPIAPQS